MGHFLTSEKTFFFGSVKYLDLGCLLHNFKKRTEFQGNVKDVNPENTKVYVEFIMDGAGVKQGEDKTFQLKLVWDPVITDNTDDTHLYLNHPLCAGGVINIKVLLFGIGCLFL